MADRLRIGIVGAGPVAERYHLSAIRGVPEVRGTAIIDVDAGRARGFAEHSGFPHWSTKVSDLIGTVDLAVVALPNFLHASVSCELLSHGIHVLCEKPMARNISECQSMIETARRSRALLCVGHNRRFKKHYQLLKALLQRHLIGDVVSIDAEEGSKTDWVRSAAYFDPVQSGGGALMDVGIHSVDLIRWLFADFQEVGYQGNGTARTVESEAELRFRLANGATGKIVSSRVRDLSQKITIRGNNGFIEAGLWSDTLRLRCDTGKPFRNFPYLDVFASRRPPADSSFVDHLYNFVRAIQGEEANFVTGEEGMAAVDVVCRAYGSQTSTIQAAAAVLSETQ
jgi:predicted dehydrogenase